MYTFIRHAEQISHRKDDPPIEDFIPNLNLEYDFIISSPYLRCRQTAAKFGKPIYIDVRLSEYQAHKHKIITLDSSSLVYGDVPIIETLNDFTKRIDEAFAYINTLPYCILVVTHGLVVKYLDEKITKETRYKRGRDIKFLTGITIRQINSS